MFCYWNVCSYAFLVLLWFFNSLFESTFWIAGVVAFFCSSWIKRHFDGDESRRTETAYNGRDVYTYNGKTFVNVLAYKIETKFKTKLLKTFTKRKWKTKCLFCLMRPSNKIIKKIALEWIILQSLNKTKNYTKFTIIYNVFFITCKGINELFLLN